MIARRVMYFMLSLLSDPQEYKLPATSRNLDSQPVSITLGLRGPGHQRVEGRNLQLRWPSTGVLHQHW